MQELSIDTTCGCIDFYVWIIKWTLYLFNCKNGLKGITVHELISIITWALSSKSEAPDDDPTACAFLYLSIVAFTLQSIMDHHNQAKGIEMESVLKWHPLCRSCIDE